MTDKPAAAPSAGSASSLKILHVLRAPLGGLFRHVIDLVQGQAARGHRVGLFLDSTTGGTRAEAVLAELAPCLALGFERVAIPRELSPRDLNALRRVSRRIAALVPDVLHGHGAKGAALARLAPAAGNAIRAYTPHGGSLVYCPGTFSGGFYRSIERVLNFRTDLFLFESSYVASLFREKIGTPRAMVRVVRNGVGMAEFEPVRSKPDATDIVCVGELRPVKAIDILIEALAILKRSGRTVTATIVGEGPEAPNLKAQADRLGITDAVHFVGYRPAREAFAMGRMLVIPSRAESLPYVVLEAAAAGVPIIATDVGGVPEIFGPQTEHLIAPDDTAALVGAINAALADPGQAHHVAHEVRARVRAEFSLGTMVEGGLAAYREAIAMRKLAQFA
ncbi:MAG TPA: glycosyltransferase family 4 protein [Xanthobacteraceae bacterium]|nr:glycosyltransferase family 4 protein [Xanthobacteraceae bacterium]